MIDWIIGTVIAAAAAAVVVKKIKDAKVGKSGCGCGCSDGCAGCSHSKNGGSCH